VRPPREAFPVRPPEAPAASRPRPPRPPVPPPLRPVPTGPRTTMAPFQAVPSPATGFDAPEGEGTLWPSSRSSRTARADAREAERRAEEERLAAERREAERREAERRAELERASAEHRAALQREADRRAAEQRAAEEREAAQRRLAEQRVADARAAAEARATDLRALAAAESVPTDRSAPWSTGPAGRRPGLPAPAPARVTGARTGPSATGPTYGDWTRPSRSGAGEDTAGSRPFTDDEEDYSSQRFARLRAGAPTETSAVPEREVAARRDAADEPDHGERGHDAPGHDGRAAAAPAPVRGPATGPTTGPVTGTIGGRAALRVERQAAEAARKKAGRKGSSSAAPDPGGSRRSPRRAALGLVAVAVVALGVLGVYSFASPDTQQAAASKSAAAPATGLATGTVPGVSDLPALSTAPVPPTSAAPVVKAPVTVLNATDVNGLAASIAGVIKAGGWQTTPVGTYQAKDVATSTVFFTQGNEEQHQAAIALVSQFPQLHGPAQRFFDVPGNAAPGLVVVATGEWKP
jgi:hypothetical protein